MVGNLFRKQEASASSGEGSIPSLSATFLPSSSVVEQPTVNRPRVGSSPTLAAKYGLLAQAGRAADS